MLRKLWDVAKRRRTVEIGIFSIDFHLRKKVGSSFHRTRPRVSKSTSAEKPIAVIFGVGPGLGYALARRLAQAGMHVVMIRRNARHLIPLQNELLANGNSTTLLSVDATVESQIIRAHRFISNQFGSTDLVISSFQSFCPGETTDVSSTEFEYCWRQNCLAPFLIGRQFAKEMRKNGKGTIIFTGSTSGIVGREEHLNLAVGRFGQRALAQVMARELHEYGVHICHLVIDGGIEEVERDFSPEAPIIPSELADTYYNIYKQPRSIWTHEIDVRPAREKFWEHC